MNKVNLLDKSREYLENYLEAYVKKGIVSDERFFLAGREIPFPQARMFNAEDGCIDTVDLHKEDFKIMYGRIPIESKQNLIDVISAIEDVVLVDIGTEFSSTTGLWIADRNPSSTVITYNRDIIHVLGFPPYLFNDLGHGIFKLNECAEFNERDKEGSINRLVHGNGIRNFEFRNKNVDYQELENVLREARGRPIVVYSERTPTIPKEMTEPIASFVGRNENSGMVLFPLINTPIRAYNGDPMIEKISNAQDYFWRTKSNLSPAREPEYSGRTRVFAAMHLYYALKIAELGKGEVYRTKEFPDLPIFTVSSLKK